MDLGVKSRKPAASHIGIQANMIDRTDSIAISHTPPFPSFTAVFPDGDVRR